MFLDLQYGTSDIKFFKAKYGIFGVMGQNVFLGVMGVGAMKKLRNLGSFI